MMTVLLAAAAVVVVMIASFVLVVVDFGDCWHCNFRDETNPTSVPSGVGWRHPNPAL